MVTSSPTNAAPEEATVPADHLLPEELSTPSTDQTTESTPIAEQHSTTAEVEELESVTSPLPPAQTSIIFGEPQTQASTEKSTIPEAEEIQTTLEPQTVTPRNEEEATGTTEELKKVCL